jgi:Zn-dependent peptidase ImmA (M78 family)
MAKEVSMPISVDLLGRWAVVEYTNDLEQEGYELFGAYSPNKHKIFLTIDQSDDEMLRTILHEIMHGFFVRSANDEHFSKKQMECVCKLVENFADLVYLDPNSKKIKYKKIG